MLPEATTRLTDRLATGLRLPAASSVTEGGPAQ